MSTSKFAVITAILFMMSAFLLGGYGCGGNSNNFVDNGITDNNPEPVVPEPVVKDAFLVTFDSQGGSYVAEQWVTPGETVQYPTDPKREHSTFLGWYPSEDFSFLFNFAASISQDITLYAKWWDINDTTDSDGDKLPDSLELSFGTDPNNPDTDDDGLTDYDELNWLNYNPLAKDTDNNGVNDGDEDADSDGLTNIQEGNIGSNMIITDTDYDDLSDYDEVMIYHTDPIKPDTDGDGVNDGVEVAIGSDPLKAQTTFDTTLESTRVAQGNNKAVDISVTMHSSSGAAGTLSVVPVDIGDNPLISPQIPGFLNAAYNLSADGSFDSATVTFTIGSEVGTISETFQPRIYYLNPENGLLEELPNQRLTNDRKIIAEVYHFSTYILLNKIAFDEVWSNDIRPPLSTDETGEAESLYMVFVIDCSGSMQGNDGNRLAPKVANDFVGKLRDNKDKAALVTFTEYASVVCELTDDKAALTSAIDSVYYYGGTDGSSGLNAAIEILQNAGKGNKYIIFLTDGEDTSRAYSYDDLIQSANNINAVIYSIGMGSANESLLTQIASETGGRYYHASAESEISDYNEGLEEIFQKIETETVDMVTDSNNDGISDYYTALINTGALKLSNGTSDLAGCPEIFGFDNDDWDGDGLKNGEEISILTDSKGQPYISMKSDPSLWDSDFDGYSDYEEVKNMHTPPMQYTVYYSSTTSSSAQFVNSVQEYIRAAATDLRYSVFMMGMFINFPDSYNDMVYEGLGIGVHTFFDWTRVDDTTAALIDYFYKYSTSQQALARNAETAKKRTMLKRWRLGLSVASDYIGLLNEVGTLAVDIGSGKYTNAGRTENANIEAQLDADARTKIADKAAKIASLASPDVIVKGKKAVLVAVNGWAKLSNTDAPDKMEEISELVEDLFSNVKDAGDKLSGEEGAFEDAPDWVMALHNIASVSSRIAAFASKTLEVANLTNKLDINIHWKWAENIADKTGFGNNALGNGIATGFTVVLDTVDTAVNCIQVAETYSKIEANYAEYQKYFELIRLIKDSERFPDYTREGAKKVADMFSENGDIDWNKYDAQVRGAIGKEIAAGAFNLIVDVAGIWCPVIGITKTVYSAASAIPAIFGALRRAKTIVEVELYFAIAETSWQLLEQVGHFTGFYCFNVAENQTTENFYKYAAQLAQARIVGLNSIMNYHGEAEIKSECLEAIREVYSVVRAWYLHVSDQLPYYDDYGK